MSEISDKVKHVTSSGQTRKHTCHWPGCTKQCAPAYWGCRKHWYMLPHNLRQLIWATYTIGQENNISLVSKRYLEAAEIVQAWIRNNHDVKTES